MLLKKFTLLKILLLVNSFNLLPAYAETLPVQKTQAMTSSSQPPSEMQSKPLSFVSNEQLLQQFQAIMQEIEAKLLAHLRAVAKQKLLLEQHQQQNPNIMLDSKTESDVKNNEVETTTIQVEAANENELENAKQQLAILQQQLAYEETEKGLLKKYHEQIDLVQTEITFFIQQVKKTKEYAWEIQLRLSDGTLLPTQIPDELNEAAQDRLRQQLFTQQQLLKQRATQVEARLIEQTEQLTQIQAAMAYAQASYAAAKKLHTQMLKRQELEQQYLQQTPEKLSNDLKALQEEWRWLFSPLQKAQHHFVQAQEKQQALAEELTEMTPPDTSQLQEIKPEDIQQATMLFKQIEEYQQKRILSLLEQQRSLQEVIEQGEALTGEATVINTHLFNMEVIAGVFEKLIEIGKADPSWIPDTLRLKSLNELNQHVTDMLVEAKRAVENAKPQLEKLAQEQEQALVP